MARKVALSLESPANRRARGHKMFMKRKMKSEHWASGIPGVGPQQPGSEPACFLNGDAPPAPGTATALTSLHAPEVCRLREKFVTILTNI